MKVTLNYKADITDPEILEIMRQKTKMHYEGLKIQNSGENIPVAFIQKYNELTDKLIKTVTKIEPTLVKIFENAQWESTDVIAKEEINNILAPIG
jgi:hypothetical protein